MAIAFAGTLEIRGNFRKTNQQDLGTPTDSITIGSGSSSGSGQIAPMKLTLTTGNGNNQAQELWHDQRTVAATTADNLDLAGSLTNAWGSTVTFADIVVIAIWIRDPDGTSELRVGPRNQSNAWQGPFGGTAATDYVESKTGILLFDGYGMGAVSGASTDVLGIYNSSAQELDYDIVIIGHTS